MSDRRTRLAALTLVGGATLTTLVIPWGPWNPAAFLVPPALLASAWLVTRRGALAALMGRAVWWSTLLFGAALAWAEPSGANLLASTGFALSAGLALLALGPAALFPVDARAPGLGERAARAPLTLTFVLGSGAFLGVLFQWALGLAYVPHVTFEPGTLPTVIIALALTVALGAGLVGLARERVYGLVVVPVALSGFLGFLMALPADAPTTFPVVLFGALTVVVTALAVSLGARILKREAPRAPARAWRYAPAVVVLAVFAALGVAVRDALAAGMM